MPASASRARNASGSQTSEQTSDAGSADAAVQICSSVTTSSSGNTSTVDASSSATHAPSSTTITAINPITTKPSFFAGMRLGMTGVLLGVLLAELYVSTAGIGYFTTLFTQNFDPTRLLGLVSVLAAMAIVLNEVVRRAEVHFGRWHAE